MLKKLSFLVLSIAISIQLCGQQGGDCAQPLFLFCGQTVTNNTSDFSNNMENYSSCAFTAKEGKEVVYQISPQNNGTLSAFLTNVTPGVDLKIVLLSGCAASSCISMSDDDPFSNDESATFIVDSGIPYFLVIDGNDIEDTGSYTLNVTCNQTTSINEDELANVTIYPNPTNRILNIKGVNLNNTTTNIFSLSGENVSKQVEFDQSKLNVETLSKGIYFISIKSGDNVITKKFTVN